MEHNLFVLVDLLGTFAFAVSGAIAAEQRRLDLFGVLAISYLTACGGGVIRDLCLGALPPVGISDWRYLATSALAAGLAIWARPIIDHLKHPIVFFDSLGLGFFAVIGAHKALQFGHSIEVAILLGMVTAVGGGVARDVVLNRVPIILEKEIYAVAALVGAAIARVRATYHSYFVVHASGVITTWSNSRPLTKSVLPTDRSRMTRPRKRFTVAICHAASSNDMLGSSMAARSAAFTEKSNSGRTTFVLGSLARESIAFNTSP